MFTHYRNTSFLSDSDQTESSDSEPILSYDDDEEGNMSDLEHDAEELLRHWEIKRGERVENLVNHKVEEISGQMKQMHLEAVQVLSNLTESTQHTADEYQNRFHTYQEQSNKEIESFIEQKWKHFQDENQQSVKHFQILMTAIEQERQRILEQERKAKEEKERLEKERLEKARLQKQQQDEAAKQKQNAPPTQLPIKGGAPENLPGPSVPLPATQASDEVSQKALHDSTLYIQFAQSFQKAAEVSKSDPKLTETLKLFYRKINMASGMYSKDKEQIMSVIERVSNILNEARSGGFFEWALDLLCRKFLEQAEDQIASHAESSGGLAAVIVAISLIESNVMKVFLGQLFRACPFSIPRYVTKAPNQSESQWKAAMGYQEGETQVQYNNRMKGMITLYAAITQTKLARQNPHGISHAWVWLARVLNMKPKPQTPSLLQQFLEIAGPDLFRVYKLQFKKMMLFIKDEYVPMMAETPEKKALVVYFELVEKEGLKPLSMFE